jgi:dTMP kinase
MLNWLARRFGRADGVELLGRHGYVAIEASLRRVAMTRAVAWSRLTGRIAVMDRWTCCQYVVMHARGDPGTRLARFCYAALPHPDLLCFLAVEPAEAQRRVRARGRDDEELDYLTALDHAYRTLPDLAGAVVVDAGRPADDVADHLDALVIRPR